MKPRSVNELSHNRLVVRPATGDSPSQRGVILVIVMWVLLVLTIIAWTYARQSQMEIRMTGFHNNSMRAYYLARAGVARALVYIREDKLKDMGVLGEDNLIEVDDKDENYVYDAPSEEWGFNPDAYGIDKEEDEEDWEGATLETARGHFFVEVEDISGKMNVNLATFEHLWRLIQLTGVEEDYAQALAAAIVDYIDEDDQPTLIDETHIDGWEFGDQSLEAYYYNPHQSPEEVDIFGGAFVMKDAPLDTIEELLLVPGMTEVFYNGEDDNQNGELDDEDDYNEDDGYENPPFDNEDGELQKGIRHFVTAYSGIATEQIGRINLNAAPFEVIQAVLWGQEEMGNHAEKSAEDIVKYRNGNDDVLGTDDDKRFRTMPKSDDHADGLDRAGLDPSDQSLVERAFGVASDYFRIKSTGVVNRVKKTIYVTVLRTFTEELELQDDAGFRLSRDKIEPEQVELLIIDFEERG